MVRKLGVVALVVGLLHAVPARAVEKKEIQEAVERGVQALQAMQGEDGTWQYTEIGATALAALTLLECGVPTTDESLSKATLALRRASLGASTTYSIALLIIYFDRLGDPNDVPLIESLTVRLMGGQNPDGGWAYQCPGAVAGEARRLADAVRQQRILVSKRDKDAKRRTVEDLPREVRVRLDQVQEAQALAVRAGAQGIISDNSNTQFATLALWIGRRHGFPVENALARIERRFRRIQNGDGGWGYHYLPTAGGGGLSASRPSMTCAGLLALAVANGAAIERGKNKEALARAAKQDRAIQAGLLALGTVVGEPIGDLRRVPEAGGASFYFLWSLERVAVALGVDTIGKKDWYNWGAEVLLANQQRDGRWMATYGSYGADTCFALLFLKRANFAEDLTAQLRGSIADPGRVLRGQGMRDVTSRMRPALDPKGSKGPPSRPADTAFDKPAEAAVKLTGLAAELTDADAAQREALLVRYRDGKGVKYSEQLAAACAQLRGELRQKARHALADRLTRMKSQTLEGYLEDEDAEIRRAAVLAVAMKDARSLTPKLIGMLEDREPAVAWAARAALKSLSGKDFGPETGASAEERQQAIDAWRGWWKQNGGK